MEPKYCKDCPHRKVQEDKPVWAFDRDYCTLMNEACSFVRACPHVNGD